jgi:hypothetical protein
MRYESDIAEMIHENAIAEFRLGILTEAETREYDELCLPPEAFKEKYVQSADAHETVNIEHADLVHTTQLAMNRAFCNSSSWTLNRMA